MQSPSASHPVQRKPVIGITMGDPAGIGPEVVVKALADPEVRSLARFVVYGLNELLAYAADQAEMEPFWYRVQNDSDRAARPIRDNVVVLDFDQFDGLLRSKPLASQAGGASSKAFVEAAIVDSLLPADTPRHLDAVVTAPISKKSWHLAGYKWPGHTELLQRRTRAKRAIMGFVSPQLRVTLATVHLPLMDIRNVLTIGRVFDAIDMGHQLCKDLGIKQPSIGVCGLNPHAGEDGQFGDEEKRLIEPAITAAIQASIDVHGPFPADTIFNAAAEGRFDLIVAMYHDQGLIPVKLLGRGTAVNVTIGLPIIRTSPDHGTAFDIAQRNVASPGSMRSAIELAASLANKRIASDTAESATQSPARSEPAA